MTQPNDIPPEPAETKAMTVWPSIAATAPGRLVGRMAAIRAGAGRFFTLGKLMAVATIPVSLAVFAWQLLPCVCRRYTLTDRRVIIQKGIRAVDAESVDLDAFDAIEVAVLPGQQWFHAGDLVFKQSGSEVLRLPGVARPEVFRQTCLKAQRALLSVRKVLERQEAAASQPAG